MIIFERLGGWGLGNSLFQIATTFAISKDNNTTYGFPNNCNFKRVVYGENSKFKNELPWVDFELFKNSKRWGTGDIRYVEPPNFNEDVVIDGFFQSEKYFKKYHNDIKNLFELKQEYKEYLINKYKSIINDDSCVIHVRRGDYFTAKELIVLDIEYYKKAVKSIGENYNYVIFSDDIPWCKSNFDFINKKTFIEEGDNILELFLMTFFKNHIIANSTFSWWGAWLSENSNVYMPNPTNNWFSNLYYEENKHNKNIDDLICEKWKVI